VEGRVEITTDRPVTCRLCLLWKYHYSSHVASWWMKCWTLYC